MGDPAGETYKDVRALGRGLRLLETLSELGWARVGALSVASGIERSSTYRLVNTLIDLEYVTRRDEDGAIALTSKLTQLADGVTQDDLATQCAWPYLFELSKDVLWPCDFASLTGGKLTIRISTHRFSPMSIHRGVVGTERSLMRSALGNAILSAMSREELELSLEVVGNSGGENAEEVRDRAAAMRTIAKVRERGYATSEGQTEAKISAIALPVTSPDERVAGAVNIVFFRSAMTPYQAAERYLDSLRRCTSRIERSLMKCRRNTAPR